ncbi:hypothetical protein AMECASPLE_009321 [Ameca splendens]|uniref:Uncharacterized protein n=1 Tax=Ameca splendens TaxID=208324 RepID=A0ABV0YB90_9TELE
MEEVRGKSSRKSSGYDLDSSYLNTKEIHIRDKHKNIAFCVSLYYFWLVPPSFLSCPCMTSLLSLSDFVPRQICRVVKNSRSLCPSMFSISVSINQSSLRQNSALHLPQVTEKELSCCMKANRTEPSRWFWFLLRLFCTEWKKFERPEVDIYIFFLFKLFQYFSA